MIFVILGSTATASNDFNFKDLTCKTWDETTPKVVVCDKSVNFKVAIEATEFWKQHGFKLSNPVARENCTREVVKNQIKFIKDDIPTVLKDNENGVTDRFFINKKMYGANIVIKKHLQNQKNLIIHELGHALGLDHSNNSNNVMYYKRRYYASNR